jgi:hypothetical protein
VYAFDRLGGVPVRHVRYDNLKAAVSRVLTGRNRLESDRWVAFRSHYLLTELANVAAVSSLAPLLDLRACRVSSMNGRMILR